MRTTTVVITIVIDHDNDVDPEDTVDRMLDDGVIQELILVRIKDTSGGYAFVTDAECSIATEDTED